MNQSSQTTPALTPIADNIIHRLQPLAASHLILENESMRHAGYYEGKESHFKLIIVSEAFAGKRLVQRHQLIYSLINDLLVQGGGQVHAFSIHAYTPLEWEVANGAPASPNCAGQHR